MKFIKMHGLGNDFVILDHRDGRQALTASQIQHICDRHMGVGCDQLVVLHNSDQADVKALFFNGDGSESGACGNATRCVADLVMAESGADECRVETLSGVMPCRKLGSLRVEVNMGAPKFDARSFDVVIEGLAAPVLVDMGNPHAVYFVDDVAAIDLHVVGPQIENNAFFPERTNVEIVQVISPSSLRQRTWERGAGETLACGSGACAVAVAAVQRGLAGREVEIALDGGVLNMHWREDDDHILMTGPVAYVFEGELLDV